MTMQETEQSILNDLALLGDALNRMEYLLGCARIAPGIPEEERSDRDLVADCQVKTWLSPRWEGGVLHLRFDSESFLVRGALSLIGEIYDGRSRAEVAAFSCRLILCEQFISLFNRDQKQGLESILRALKEGAAA